MEHQHLEPQDREPVRARIASPESLAKSLAELPFGAYESAFVAASLATANLRAERVPQILAYEATFLIVALPSLTTSYDVDGIRNSIRATWQACEQAAMEIVPLGTDPSTVQTLRLLAAAFYAIDMEKREQDAPFPEKVIGVFPEKYESELAYRKDAEKHSITMVSPGSSFAARAEALCALAQCYYVTPGNKFELNCQTAGDWGYNEYLWNGLKAAINCIGQSEALDRSVVYAFQHFVPIRKLTRDQFAVLFPADDRSVASEIIKILAIHFGTDEQVASLMKDGKCLRSIEESTRAMAFYQGRIGRPLIN